MLPYNSIKYQTIWKEINEYEMSSFDPFLVSCRIAILGGLSPGEHLVCINLDLLARSATCTTHSLLHGSPFAFDNFDAKMWCVAVLLFQHVSTMRLLQCLELHSHWNIWSRVCVPSSFNLGSCRPCFPLKMSWHKPEATARVLKRNRGIAFLCVIKVKMHPSKDLLVFAALALSTCTTSHKYVLKKRKERLWYLWRHLSLRKRNCCTATRWLAVLGEVG